MNLIKKIDAAISLLLKYEEYALKINKDGYYKTVIFVLEHGHEKDKYLQFLKQFADVVYENIDAGIGYLKTF